MFATKCGEMNKKRRTERETGSSEAGSVEITSALPELSVGAEKS